MAYTKCWDCANATTDGCSWAKDLKPVKGWEAEPTVKQNFRGEPLKSFLVIRCPKFKQDAMNGGLIRIPKASEADRRKD